MLRKNLWITLLSGLLLIGVTGICLAENPPAPGPGPAPAPAADPMMRDFRMSLDQLVVQHIINGKQADMIVVYFDNFARDSKDKPPVPIEKLKADHRDPLSLLIRDHVINPDQASAVERLLPHPPAPRK